MHSLHACIHTCMWSQVTTECGLQSVVPKVWVEPVNGILPGKGFHIKWLGLWTDLAEGASLQNIQVRQRSAYTARMAQCHCQFWVGVWAVWGHGPAGTCSYMQVRSHMPGPDWLRPQAPPRPMGHAQCPV